MKKSNEFLKECLGDALLKIMKKKPFHRIRVVEVVEAAQVSRSTYYRNFQSLEEVLMYKFNQLLETWVEQQSDTPHQDPAELFISLFRYLKSLQDTLTLMIRADLDMLLFASAYRILESKPLIQHDQYREVYHSFGLTGLILSWIKRGMKESPTQMADMVVRIITPLIKS